MAIIRIESAVSSIVKENSDYHWLQKKKERQNQFGHLRFDIYSIINVLGSNNPWLNYQWFLWGTKYLTWHVTKEEENISQSLQVTHCYHSFFWNDITQKCWKGSVKIKVKVAKMKSKGNEKIR